MSSRLDRGPFLVLLVAFLCQVALFCLLQNNTILLFYLIFRNQPGFAQKCVGSGLTTSPLDRVRVEKHYEFEEGGNKEELAVYVKPILSAFFVPQDEMKSSS